MKSKNTGLYPFLALFALICNQAPVQAMESTGTQNRQFNIFTREEEKKQMSRTAINTMEAANSSYGTISQHMHNPSVLDKNLFLQEKNQLIQEILNSDFTKPIFIGTGAFCFSNKAWEAHRKKLEIFIKSVSKQTGIQWPDIPTPHDISRKLLEIKKALENVSDLPGAQAVIEAFLKSGLKKPNENPVYKALSIPTDVDDGHSKIEDCAS